MDRARALYERAVYGGDTDAVVMAGRELDRVEADLLLARGRLVHVHFLAERDAAPKPPPGDPAELTMFERAAHLYRVLGDVRGEGEAILWIGVFHQVVGGDDDLAVPFLTHSLELATRAGDMPTMAEALRHLGIADHRAGRLDRAREELESSVRLRRETGLLAGVASNLIGLAYIAAAQGRLDDASSLIYEASGLAATTDASRIERHIEVARGDLGLK